MSNRENGTKMATDEKKTIIYIIKSKNKVLNGWNWYFVAINPVFFFV